MKEEKAKKLLGKYLNGAASKEEKSKVDDWYGDIQFDDSLSVTEKAKVDQQLKSTLLQKIRPAQTRKLYATWLKVAAAVLVTTLGTLWLITSVKSPANYIVVTTAEKPQSVKLPDGSLVKLAAHSSLKFPKVFTGNRRSVVLQEGEAFFDVVHNEASRFSVVTHAGVAIKVLGTSFLVKSFAKQENVEVQVSTGKVEVSDQLKSLAILTRGDQLIYNKSARNAKRIFKTPVKSVPLLFDGTSIALVAQKLSYSYNVNIALHPSVNTKLKTTAQFNSAQSLEEILNLICKLHQLHYRVSADAKKYTIYK